MHVRVGRAVPHGVDVPQARLAAQIDDHTVVGLRAGRHEGLDRGIDADADDHQIGGDRLTAHETNAAHSSVLLLELDDLRTEMDVDAVRTVLALEEP